MKPLVELTSQCIVTRKAGIPSTQVEKDLVMMNINQNSFYGLDNVGKVIWGKLESPISVDTLCFELMNMFDVSQDVCQAEVLTFLQQLHNESMLEIIHK